MKRLGLSSAAIVLLLAVVLARAPAAIGKTIRCPVADSGSNNIRVSDVSCKVAYRLIFEVEGGAPIIRGFRCYSSGPGGPFFQPTTCRRRHQVARFGIPGAG